ncbi:helix-turn-helix transcriptional regulator [Photobacterium profundum]|uniref:helix-turn-helix transcriptional regulator n=1 Tax=Photobacterium profundum TaxID=74109 RepID=UPI0002D83FF4|nr:helix-turn-helix domain-containing protein [Photobacterium profundum]
MGKGYLTTTQVCKYFGVSRATIWRWCKEGYFPIADLDEKTKRWKIETIESFENSNK